jgi:hypothetical protein
MSKGALNRLASEIFVLEPKFVKRVIQIFAVIPAKAGIQKSFKFLDSGSRYPGL